MLSAGRVLKSVGLHRPLFLTGVRSLALGLNERPDYAKEILPLYKRQLKSEVEYLEANTRRFGRIDPYLFKRCMDSVHDEQLTTKESLILLKCCGPLMFNQEKAQRIRYIEQLWSVLKEKRMPLDIMHYNLLIKMYTENGHQFEPMELVNEMRSVGIEPNHRTYEFVVNKYCLDGDLEKVTRMLEKMNEEGKSLTGPIFDSLILAYFLNHDVNQALETFKMMKESGIDVTNSTYKNLIIGHLKNYDPNATLETIRQLITENSIEFEIAEATSIIEQIGKDVPSEQASALKHLLVDHLKETIGFFNELSNCCYTLIQNNEHEVVKLLYEKFFTDDQSRHYFIKRLTVSILKSDQPKVMESIQLLKRLLPNFNFSGYARGTLMSEEFDLEKTLQVMDELHPTLERTEYSAYPSLLEKCENMDQLHMVTERYLSFLDANWISHIKRHFLPRLQVDLFEFYEEHLKRNSDRKSQMILQTSLFCFYMDQLDIEQLLKFCERFRPNIALCSVEYLMDRAEQVIADRPAKLEGFVRCIAPKIKANQSLNRRFMKLCLATLNSEQLTTVLSVYEALGLPLSDRDLDEKERHKLLAAGSHLFLSEFEKLIQKLEGGSEIAINSQLSSLRRELTAKELNEIILTAIRVQNYQVAAFFLYPEFKFSKRTLIRYLCAMLNAGEDPKKAISFFEAHFDDSPLTKLGKMRDEVAEICQKIQHDEDLVYRFVDKFSQLVEPEELVKYLIELYKQTKDEQIGRKLIDLNVYLRKTKNKDAGFQTMVALIEGRNTAVLQELSNSLMNKSELERSEVYNRLAIAFVYTKRYKQAVKVIELGEFYLDKHTLYSLFDYLRSNNRSDVIKEFSILIYQKTPQKRKVLLKLLNDYAVSRENQKLFQEILQDIKRLHEVAERSPSKEAAAPSPLSREPAAPVKEPEAASETIELIQRPQGKKEVLELADQRINQKKELKINVECDLIDKLIQFGELDKATELVYDMLVNERFPAPQVIKNYYKALNLNGKLAAIERLDPYVPKQLKESEFYRNNQVLTRLRTTDSDEEIRKCLESVEIFSLDLIDQALTIKPTYEQQIVELLKAKKKSNLRFVWLHFMQNGQYEKALNLVTSNGEDLSARNLLFQPIVNIAKQTGNLPLARELAAYATKFDLRTDTVQSIYGAYIKLCLSAGQVGEAAQAIRDHYRTKPDVKLNLNTLSPKLIEQFDKAFINEFVDK